MTQIYENLFETYGEAELKALGCGFDEKMLDKWLEGILLGGKTRFLVMDGLFDLYHRWASAAFGSGLRLGLALSNDQVRRCSPE